ncbi:hypothetical protein QBC46DRAFT_354772 [Diplogelasinospora grovesii]|uniref:Uncharacterized protein n=1 Tax=Diplogelasinospora grovesii TaxID=303347 RepID=A0AAN6N8L5_9PEZI|nr:hypothetical protein QBC46DRAFT_354772 [Diplogelasinospora grovesii]
MSDNEKLNEIARQAERDLNTYQAKTGTGQTTGLEDAGVNELSEDKFPGSQAKYGDDLVTNAGYNRRMPGDEGGDVDERGRMVKGSAYEGVGGPEDKVAKGYEQHSGQMDESDVKGEDYYTPEEVPDSTADQNEVPPESATAASRYT